MTFLSNTEHKHGPLKEKYKKRKEKKKKIKLKKTINNIKLIKIFKVTTSSFKGRFFIFSLEV